MPREPTFLHVGGRVSVDHILMSLKEAELLLDVLTEERHAAAQMGCYETLISIARRRFDLFVAVSAARTWTQMMARLQREGDHP